jgi:hypothetical protein
MVRGWARISFWVSGIKRQNAAKALKHSGHPLATLSVSFSDIPLAVCWALGAESTPLS